LIAESPGLSQGELALVMGLQLIKSGWVQHQGAEDERRRNNLHVTPEGHAALKHMVNASRATRPLCARRCRRKRSIPCSNRWTKVAAAADPR